ncbi:MAG: biotin/lipoate A/B protein ligase family protein [Leptospirillia bacterium]
MQGPWHLVTHTCATAPEQMAVDQVLAESVWRGLRPPTLRLYTWLAPALTIGRHQRAGRLPCPAVRRITGGRAVYHEHELTVSLALARHHLPAGPSVRATYRMLSAPLSAALNALGLAVDPEENTRPRPGNGFNCFTSPTPDEATVNGAKAIAVAQRIEPDGLLLQASLPIAPPKTLPGAAESGIAGLSKSHPGLDAETLAQAVTKGFRTLLGANLARHPLTPEESRRARHLADSAYALLPGGQY